MKIIAQSKTTSTSPYLHLAYTAATTPHLGLLIPGIVLVAFGTVLANRLSKLKKKCSLPDSGLNPRKEVIKRVSVGFACIILGAVLLYLSCFVYGTSYKKHHTLMQRQRSCANLRAINEAFVAYAGRNDSNIPSSEQWCDLIADDGTSVRNLVVLDSGIAIGESAYALNEHVADMKLPDIPPDTVLLFESEAGIGGSEDLILLSNRNIWKYIEEDSLRDERVFKDRWNQVSDRSTLTTDYQYGKGCVVLFADGRAEFVPVEEISELRWTIDQTANSSSE